MEAWSTHNNFRNQQNSQKKYIFLYFRRWYMKNENVPCERNFSNVCKLFFWIARRMSSKLTRTSVVDETTAGTSFATSTLQCKPLWRVWGELPTNLVSPLYISTCHNKNKIQSIVTMIWKQSICCSTALSMKSKTHLVQTCIAQTTLAMFFIQFQRWIRYKPTIPNVHYPSNKGCSLC